ncbi:MAG: undecaprenyl-diphosphate phosphatase [Clostridia bacterium]|jgi:undecaprenyl-diphosphatase|nr:undecaprenyl-diphosphate phosphatase [Clostridia bacterium]
MKILIALLLGLVQGLCEFLPVSSSGHLYLVEKLTGGAVGEGYFGSFFVVMLHVATLIAVLFVYREQVGAILRHPLQPLTLYLIVATLPTVAAALILKKWDALDAWIENGNLLGVSFLLTAAFLTVSELLCRRRKPKKSIGTMRWTDALAIGGMQAIGILPGVSRSGATIAGALGRRMDRRSAADFSFLLSVPAILGALILELYKLVKTPAAVAGGSVFEFGATLILGMLAAAISGYFAVRFMIRLVTKKGLFGFAVYTAVLGVAVLILQLTKTLGFGFTPFGG